MYAEGVRKMELHIESEYGEYDIFALNHHLFWFKNEIIHWHADSWILVKDGVYIAHFRKKGNNVQETIETKCNS